MYEMIFLWVLGLVWIIFAVVQDWKTREIANWLNYSLIIFALGYRFFYSAFNGNFSFFFNGLIGFGIFWLIGNLFYYGKIFAGGDAKLMIALGAVLPASSGIIYNLQSFLGFILLFLFIGFAYTLATSTFFCIKYFKNFKKEFLKQIKQRKTLALGFVLLSIAVMLLGFMDIMFLALGIMIFLIPFLYFYSKAIDEACMIKRVRVEKLSEGDWLYKDLKAGTSFVKADWDGLTKNSIAKLKKKYKEVEIRQGIPFSPTFLLSFIIFILFSFLNKGLWNPFFNF